MKLTGKGKLLRILIGESDKIHHQSLFDAIVIAAREQGLAGSTVLRGIEGFGANSRYIHSAKILRLSEDLPIVIEIVDTEKKIKSFLPIVDKLLESAGGGAMVTMEKVDIIRYSAGKSK
jgi:uncharacterized protein